MLKLSPGEVYLVPDDMNSKPETLGKDTEKQNLSLAVAFFVARFDKGSKV